jgi:hypothetical protein
MKQIKDIRLTKGKLEQGVVIEVNYGDGWEDIKEVHLKKPKQERSFRQKLKNLFK